MAENNKWSDFIKNFRDFFTLSREIVILILLAVLVLDAKKITPVLKNMGSALKEAGFTELNIGILKQDLTKVQDNLQATGLNTQQAQESLKKATITLNETKKQILDPNTLKGIENALSFISLSQSQLGFAKQQIQDAKSITESQTALPSPTVLSNSKPWIVIVGADKTPKSAQDEVNRAKNNGFKNAKILFRENQYRTVIPFATQQEADDNFQKIVEKIRQGSYIRNIDKWCASLESAKLDNIAFEKCDLPK
jgi:hypothetical protein